MENELIDIREIMIHYLDGSATLEEEIILLNWLRSSDNNRNDFISTRDLWLSCDAVADNKLEVDIALKKFRRRISDEVKKEEKKTVVSKHKLMHRPFVFWGSIAASIIIVFCIGYGFNPKSLNVFTATKIQKQLITAMGSKGKFTLPDGTIVWLNSESSLTYPEQFTNKQREVILDGEAYFEVKRNTQKPFIVKAGNMNIEVLGTKFNVQNYKGSNSFKTALLKGSVKITGDKMSRSVVLKPDELFCMTKNNLAYTVSKTNAELYANWIKDKLIFDNTRLSDIIVSMEGHYHTTITCPPQFANDTHLSLTIRNESLDEVLKSISFIAPIHYKIMDSEVQIFPYNKPHY